MTSRLTRLDGQAYILRASWFRYVDEELGREVVLDLAAAREGLDPEPVELVLGASLEQVDAAGRVGFCDHDHPEAPGTVHDALR